MKRLGYTHYVAQGGDWGAVITDVMAVKEPPGLIGIHSNMPGVIPPEVAQEIRFVTGAPAPAGLSAEEQSTWEQINFLYTKGIGYAVEMATSPQTLYAPADSPVAENAYGFFDAKNVSIPAAVTVFPNEIYKAPRSWTERAYPNLVYFNEVDRGGHFAAWQEPELFSAEVRTGFRSLR
jgi:pimeloyl-ACP methyl ester carboxylesterase